MINKRLLIKRLLTYNDENSFYDKKRQLNLHSKEGKGKFLKHICALTNANPNNNSYIIVGVEDENNLIKGVDFFDDSKIQNLVNAYLHNPPSILYENIPFPKLSKNKVVGLVTIKHKEKSSISSFKKTIYKYYKNFTYKRIGSNSAQMIIDVKLKDTNSTIVSEIEKSAKNNIKHTLDAVTEFMRNHKNRTSQYYVFKEQFVVCWSGIKKQTKDNIFYSRVSIEMITEQVKLFYSTLDEVAIHHNENSFIITEYITLGIHDDFKRYPLEKKIIHFYNNGNYRIASEILFKPPLYNKKTLFHIYNSSSLLIEKIRGNIILNNQEKTDLLKLPATTLILKLNGFDDVDKNLKELKNYFKSHSQELYLEYKQVLRVLRKIKYQ